MYKEMFRKLESKHLRLFTGLVMLAAIATMFASNGMSLASDLDEKTRNLRYNETTTKLSGNVGIVSINEKSIENIGTFPWPRRTYGEIIDALGGKGVKRLAFDISFSSNPPDETDNKIFAESMRNADFDIALALAATDAEAQDQGILYPQDILRREASELTSIWVDTDEDNKIHNVARARVLDGAIYRTIGPWLADGPMETSDVKVDWSIDHKEIPTFEVSDILAGKVNEEDLQGKNLIIGVDADILGDEYAVSTGERLAGARVQIMAAETILKGQGQTYSGIPVGIIAMAIMLGLTLFRNRWLVFPGIASTAAILIAFQWNIEAAGVGVIPIGQALTGIATFGIGMIGVNILYFIRNRMTKDADTGLPNRTCMRLDPLEPGYTMVVQITNDVDIVSTCGAEARDKIMQKVARNIKLATNGRKIYQISSGGFAWRDDKDSTNARETAETVMQVLRPGITFANGKIDIHATIGMTAPSKKSANDSISQAVIAATRANVRGIAIEEWSEDDGADEWRVTVVSELERAIANDDLWIAYQPKIDPKTSRVIGAEALVRWEHPQKGNIRPDAFIPLIEKANRIDDLTAHMIDRSIREIAALNSDINIAVNVSPLVMGRGILVPMVMESIEKHGLPTSRFTVEVTESEAFKDPKAIEELEYLKKQGVGISIDDYGTGQSTINYLKIIPATELKIDRSFIANVIESHSDRMVVKSTIGLAHQMKMKVVAEGVENAEVLGFLTDVGCDIIQGYHTGRPVDLEKFSLIIEEQVSQNESAAA